MKSIISSAVLGAVALAQSGMAASIHQHHLAHVHRRAPTPAPVAEDKRGLIGDIVQFISTSDLATLATKGIKTGVNAACADKSAANPITVGSDGGAFVVEMNNNSPDDIVLVVWTGEGQWGAVSASFIGASQPAVTHTLKSNTTTWISFDPTQVSGNSVSGGWGAIYPDTTLTSYSGQLGNTWAEYTFTTDSQFSTVDVSRLVYMGGNKMELHNYADKASADNDDIKPVCSSTMDKCAFVCADGEDHCIAGSITGCPVGEAGNTSDGVDNGGCAGLSAEGGYIVSNFF